MTKSNLQSLFRSSKKESAYEAESLVGEAESLRCFISGKKRNNKSVKMSSSSSCASEADPQHVSSTEDYKQLWMKHEVDWNNFSALPPQSISFSNVPFPPCDNDVLEFTSTVNDIRPSKAYHLACLRYHPDKFMQQFGKYLLPCETESIVARLTAITQSINSEWEGRKKKFTS